MILSLTDQTKKKTGMLLALQTLPVNHRDLSLEYFFIKKKNVSSLNTFDLRVTTAYLSL